MQSFKVSGKEHGIQRRWLSLFTRISSDPAAKRRLAGPFLSVPPEGYDPTRVPSILYVGKATWGKWCLPTRLRSRTVKDTRKYTADFLKKYAETGEYDCAFWRFAGHLSKRVADATESDIEPLQNLVWTNIYKIGVKRGNPSGSVLKAQCELAIESLQLEIGKYRPRLVVFVTGDYGEEIINAALRDIDPTSWRKERQDEKFWWREPAGGMPALLWAYHPERKRASVLNVWLEEASRLAKMAA